MSMKPEGIPHVGVKSTDRAEGYRSNAGGVSLQTHILYGLCALVLQASESLREPA